MMALEVWFDKPDPTIVKTAQDLDAVLDAVIPGTIAQLLILDDPDGHGVLDVGLDTRTGRGVVRYFGGEPEGTFGSLGVEAGNTNDDLVYHYMGSSSHFSATEEIPLTECRKAAHEYMQTNGERPASITWQDVS